jgi:hypothetical protein
MPNRPQTRSIALGDLIALAFDAAESVTARPQLAAALATHAVETVLSERRQVRRSTAR